MRCDNLSERRKYVECCNGSGGHGQRCGRVAAHYHLSTPNADRKQKRNCAIKLNPNGRLDNLLSAIRRTYPHEDMYGPMDVPRAAAGGPQQIRRGRAPESVLSSTK